MGGERGSTTRQRLSGEICCACKNLLPAPHTPGERYCERCRPPLKVVYVSFEQKAAGWHLVLFDSTTQQRLCTHVFQDEGKLYELAKRGRALTNLEAKQSIERAISQGKGGVFLRLPPEQYAKLKRGRAHGPDHDAEGDGCAES
jgi:hypothetical protein